MIKKRININPSGVFKDNLEKKNQLIVLIFKNFNNNSFVQRGGARGWHPPRFQLGGAHPPPKKSSVQALEERERERERGREGEREREIERE